MYTKKQRLRIMNQSLCQIVLTSVENTISKEGSCALSRCEEVIRSVVPGSTNIQMNPIRFDVDTVEGTMSVVFKNGKFSEE